MCVICGCVCVTHRCADWNVCLLIWLTINCELLRFKSCFSSKGCSVSGDWDSDWVLRVCLLAAWRINQLQKPQICICKFKLSTFLRGVYRMVRVCGMRLVERSVTCRLTCMCYRQHCKCAPHSHTHTYTDNWQIHNNPNMWRMQSVKTLWAQVQDLSGLD